MSQIPNISWLSSTPPPERRITWTQAHIVSPRPGMPVRVYALTDHVEGKYQHFDGRSLLCTESRDCALCEAGCRRRWKGYLACCTIDLKRTLIVEVTAQAEKELSYLRGYHGSLTNVTLTFWRPAGKKNGQVSVKGDACVVPLKDRPKAFDVVPAVLYIHGYTPEEIERLMQLRRMIEGK